MTELEAIIAAGPQHPQYAFVTGTSTMADKIEDGGPAYPQMMPPLLRLTPSQIEAADLAPKPGSFIPVEPGVVEVIGQGISARDYFAAAALQGMNASCQSATSWPDETASGTMARVAYMQADAMLSARKKGGE